MECARPFTVESSAVYMMDDDIVIANKDTTKLFLAWKAHPKTITGPLRATHGEGAASVTHGRSSAYAHSLPHAFQAST